MFQFKPISATNSNGIPSRITIRWKNLFGLRAWKPRFLTHGQPSCVVWVELTLRAQATIMIQQKTLLQFPVQCSNSIQRWQIGMPPSLERRDSKQWTGSETQWNISERKPFERPMEKVDVKCLKKKLNHDARSQSIWYGCHRVSQAGPNHYVPIQIIFDFKLRKEPRFQRLLWPFSKVFPRKNPAQKPGFGDKDFKNQMSSEASNHSHIDTRRRSMLSLQRSVGSNLYPFHEKAEKNWLHFGKGCKIFRLTQDTCSKWIPGRGFLKISRKKPDRPPSKSPTTKNATNCTITLMPIQNSSLC